MLLSFPKFSLSIFFKNEKCIKQIKLLETHYICREEKEFYKNLRTNNTQLDEDKMKLARIQYKRDGRYIDEILGNCYFCKG